MIREVISYLRKYPFLIILLFIGWIINLSLVLPINANIGHDTYWHMALISAAFHSYPPQVPIFAGESLMGYNYLLDFIMFLFTRIGISAIYVYVFVIPFMYLISMSVLTIHLAKKFKNSIYFVTAFVFFTFLATPFSYLLSFYKRGSFFYGYEFPTTMQSSTVLSNMSYAFTVPLAFLVLIIILNKKISAKDSLWLGLLVALAFGIKFYGGVVIGFIVFINLFFRLLQNKDLKSFLKSSVIIGICSAITIIYFYDPFSSVETGSIFGFAPLATVHPFIEDPDSLYIQYLVMARYTLMESSSFSPRLFGIELFTILLYVLYNAGTRFIGFFTIVKRIVKRQISLFELTLLATILFAGSMSVLFVQKGGDWWNTVQFFGYGLLLLNFFSALFIYEISKIKPVFKTIIYSSLIILTLPLNIELITRAVNRANIQSFISPYEMEALNYLKKQENGVIFSVPVRYDSSYIPAYAEKPVYYANENILTNIGVNFEARKQQIADLPTLNIEKLDIDYYYLVKKDKDYTVMAKKIKKSGSYVKDYENKEVIIYRMK